MLEGAHMKFESSIQSEHMNIAVLFAGLIVAGISWKLLDGRIQELQWQPVYGESAQSEQEISSSESYESLPLVKAVGKVSSSQSLMLNDRAIEAAFRDPIFAAPIEELPEDAVEDEVEGPNLGDQFLIKYRPLIGAVSSNGVVVSGVFWKFGEKMTTMPMQAVSENGQQPTGEVIYPRVIAARGGTVTFTLQDVRVPVEFDRF